MKTRMGAKIFRPNRVAPESAGENDEETPIKQHKLPTNSARKAKEHTLRLIAMFYCFVVFAVGLSTTIFMGEKQTSLPSSGFYLAFYGTLNVSSTIMMLIIMFHVLKYRRLSFEAVQKKNPTAYKLVYSLKGEKVNHYLRLGLALFAVMSITYTVMQCIEVSANTHQNPWLILYFCTKIGFFVIQTVFILWLHRIVLLSRARLFSFFLLHLVTTNMCLWADAATAKTMKGLAGGGHGKSHHGDHSYQIPAAIYFLPAVPEYCVLAGAILYELTHRVGQMKQIETEHEKHKRNICGRSTNGEAGVVVGVILTVLVLAVILILETTGSWIKPYRLAIHLGESFLICALGVIGSSVAIYFLRRLKFSVNFANYSLDEKLLLVTYFMTVNYLISTTAVSILRLTGGIEQEQPRYLCIVRLVCSILEMAEVTVQTYFIQDSFYRCSQDKQYQQRKPGRSLIAFLIAVNFSLWMILSFQSKHNDIIFNWDRKTMKHFPSAGLQLLLHLSLPLAMLYRFHSSACLSSMFTRVYEDEVTRYESLIRGISDSNENLQNLGKLPTQTKGVRHNVNQKYEESISSLDSPRRASVAIMTTDDSKPMFSVRDPHSSAAPFSYYQKPIVPKRRGTLEMVELAHLRVASSEISNKLLQQKVQRNKSQRDDFKSRNEITNDRSPTPTRKYQHARRNESSKIT